jgi:hypothetical protein
MTMNDLCLAVSTRHPFDQRRFLEVSSTRPILREHWSWLGATRKSLYSELAHLQEMERIADSARASGSGRGRFTMANSFTGRVSNATWDRSVSSNYVYRAVIDRTIADLTLPGAERAQGRADPARHHS